VTSPGSCRTVPDEHKPLDLDQVGGVFYAHQGASLWVRMEVTSLEQIDFRAVELGPGRCIDTRSPARAAMGPEGRSSFTNRCIDTRSSRYGRSTTPLPRLNPAAV
jgi:hypothetical protein